MKKQNIIIVLLVLVLVWLGVLSWFFFALDKKLELHEFYLREILQKI